MHPAKPLIAAVVAAILAAPAALAQAPAVSTGGAAFAAVGPVALQADVGAIIGDPVEVRGRLAAAAGEAVRIEREDAETSTWTAVARTTVDDDGSFVARWETFELGSHALRAVPVGSGEARSSAVDIPTALTTVFRPARATWYGPGFWGARTACGQRLRRSTLGVAHRKLKCGTRVVLFHEGAAIEVPVIDRGPFTNGASWDLTQTAAERIGMTTTTRIGWARAVPAPARAAR